MPKHRIIERPSVLDPTQPVYEVEERILWWWQNMGLCTSLQEAQDRVKDLRRIAKEVRVKRRVVQEYD